MESKAEIQNFKLLGWFYDPSSYPTIPAETTRDVLRGEKSKGLIVGKAVKIRKCHKIEKVRGKIMSKTSKL